MPLVTTRAGAGSFGLGWGAAAGEEELGGMVLIEPTSIAYSGTSASIGTNGSVEFTAVTSLSLNGVFDATYDNYQIVMRQATTTGAAIQLRLRVGGIDNSTASSYTRQFLDVDGTTLTAARQTFDYAAGLAYGYNTQRAGQIINVYGPYLAQPTAFRCVSAHDANSANWTDVAVTHNQSTSYDGFTFFPNAGTFTGLVSVYGLVGA